MKTLYIVGLFALILTAQVYGRPDKYDNGYAEDAPQDYDDDDGDTIEKGNRGISGPPVIISKSVNFDVEAGKTVEFPCETKNADDLAVQWKKDGTDLYIDNVPMTSDTERIKHTASNSLIITNVTKEDSSNNYVCVILTNPKSIQLIHTLRVDNDWMNKSIRPWPKKTIHVNEGDSIKFGCETKFNPSKEVAWSLKGERPKFNEKIEGNFITIDKASYKNHGLYQCLVEDGSGIVHYETVDIIVNFVPVVEVTQDFIHTGIGMNATLTCIVHSHPHAKVHWFKNKDALNNEKKNKNIITDVKSHEHNLNIKFVTKDDLGIYTCSAKNSKGTASKDIELTGKPKAPKFNTLKINDDDSTFTLEWDVESFSPILEYMLEYREKNTEEWKVEKPKVINGKGHKFIAEYSFKNLLPNKYEATLMARNEFGWSKHSTIKEFAKEVSSDEPQNVKGADSSASITRPFTVFAALFLVVVSYVSIRL